MTTLDFAEITKKHLKSHYYNRYRKKRGNNQGKLTVRHHGGGHKRQYRVIDLNVTKTESLQS